MVKRGRIPEALILFVFAACIVHLVYTIRRPNETQDSFIDNSEPVLLSPDSEHRNLYLRHSFYLSDLPDSAWVKLMTHDLIEVYVNGTLLETDQTETVSTTLVCDLKPFLHPGKNVLAIVVRKYMLQNEAELAVAGQYSIGKSIETIGVNSGWKCSTRMDRLGDYWNSVDFDDTQWLEPRRAQARFKAKLDIPPEVIVSAFDGQWISTRGADEHAVVLDREFAPPEPVIKGWLRVQSNANWRFALNGRVVTSEEKTLGAGIAASENAARIYEITPWVRGQNRSIRFLLRAEQSQPKMRADVVVVGLSGKTYTISTDSSWRYQPHGSESWTQLAGDSDDWKSSNVLTIDDRSISGKSYTTLLPLEAPPEMEWAKLGKKVGVMLLVALALLLTMEVLGLCCGGIWSRAEDRNVRPAILAFILPTIMLALAILVTHDHRIPDSWLYRPGTLLVTLGLVVSQWLALLWLRYPLRDSFRSKQNLASLKWDSYVLIPVTLIAIVGFGAYLRFEQITARPLSPDEVTMYRVSMSIWEYGYPTLHIHDDLPVVRSSTSEIVPYGHWLVSIFAENERVVVRTMPAIFGVAAILLMFRVGQVMFNPWVGVIAAGVHALSPYCISMANSARYYSQLQFMALLVVYFLYRCISPQGPISKKYFWATVGAFCLMFLTWEGSALMGIGLALAGLIYRRDRIDSLLLQPFVWLGVFAVAIVVLVQSANRALVQTARPLFGSGASDVSLTPMWEYPVFKPSFYIQASTWNHDTLIPMISLLLAVWISIRHPFARQTRYLLIIFLCTCLLQALLLPVTASRYGYHLTTLWQLFGAAGIWALWREITRWRPYPYAALSFGYRRFVAAVLIVPFLMLNSGLGTDLSELTTWRMAGKLRSALKFPGQDRTSLYVLRNSQPGDAVIVNAPHVIDHYLKRPSDYWLQSQLHLQCLLTDVDSVPRHRYKGTPMLSDVEHLQDLFAKKDRIWFIAEPGFNNRTNDPEVTRFIRDNMDVVFEDYSSIVLFRDQHRSARVQRSNEKTLNKGQVYLP